MIRGQFWKPTDEYTVERSLYVRLLSEFEQWLGGDSGDKGKETD